MSETALERRPVRVLSLDGGGIRGLSCLMMLRSIMNKIADDEGLENADDLKPADYFDLICGTSTGGLIAILLGRLRLTTKEAILLYRDLAKRIFSKERGLSVGGLRVSVGGQERYDANVLKEVIQDVVRSKLGDCDARMYENTTQENTHRCRTFLLAIIADDTDTGEPHLFTTYDRNDKTTIWEAARATSAATGFFEPALVGDPPVRYVDAGLGFNNPSQQAYDEARTIWPNHKIGVFLSLGTGRESEASLPDHQGWFGLGAQVAQVKVLIKLTTSARRVHVQLFKIFGRVNDSKYFRFNVEHGLAQIGLDEWNHEGKLAGFTTAYFDDPEIKYVKELCAARLRQLTAAAKPFVLSADKFQAVHEDDVDNPGVNYPDMGYWYREKVSTSGYPDGVTVDSKFQDSDVKPPGNTILSCRRVCNLQVRGQTFKIAHGRYRVKWLVWLWAGKTFPPGGGHSTPVAQFTENSVLERVFPPKNPKASARTEDLALLSSSWYFPFDLRFSVGRALNPGDSFEHSNVDVKRHPLVAHELLQPGFQEYRLEAGLHNTYKNNGWCEIGDELVDVGLDGHLAFVVSLWECTTFVKPFGGFSFAGVRLSPVPY